MCPPCKNILKGPKAGSYKLESVSKIKENLKILLEKNNLHNTHVKMDYLGYGTGL